MGDPTPPQPLHNLGSPAPPPPPEMVSFDKCFKAATDGPIPPPPPPAQPQPLLLGQNNRVLVKISVSPPNVSRSIHTTAHGVSHVGSCGAPGVARNTGVRGVSVCHFQNLHFPQPQEQAGRIPRWGMPWWGIPRWQSRSTLVPFTAQPGPQPPREEPRGLGELRLLNQEADQALPTPTAVVETSSPKKSQHQRRGCFASPPCFATAIHGALWSRPSLSLCVPQPLGVSDLLLAGPDGAYIARKSAS